ncbi:MAG: hypothetical protein ACI9TV_001691 [Sulfurimonas sp.]|jgi:hypothetical protein|uniref:DUF695 domain-containing protein n=1 Tax=Sulfurimonas sp. TaxID=2022749 RepID=UPI0039E3BE3F
MREIFSRVEDTSIFNIEVNIDAGEIKSDNPWLFSVFVKYGGLDDSSEAYEEFLETKESLIIAIEYEDKAHYLGSRMVDGWTEFYFCASTSKELNPMVTSILKDTGYAYESNIIKDKKWNFYELQLFPTELEFIHIQSDKIIFLLEEEGEDLEILRDVEHYISFLTPTQKNRFLNTLELDGFSFKDDISTEEFEHGVALVKKHAVTNDVLNNVLNGLYIKIKENQGFYEGWSTTLVNTEEN